MYKWDRKNLSKFVRGQIRAAVFDLDNTILNDDGELKPRVAQGFRHLRDIGLEIILATGRTTDSVLHTEIANLDRFLVGERVVCSNGGLVANLHTGVRTDLLILSPIFCEKIIEQHCESSHVVMEKGGCAYSFTKEGILMYSLVFKVPDKKVGLISAPFAANNIVKILIFPNGEHCIDGNCDIRVTDIGHFRGISVTNRHADKIVGIKYYMNELNIGLESVMAFGDEINDIEMITQCKLGISVRGCNPVLKNISDIHLDEDIGDFILSL